MTAENTADQTWLTPQAFERLSNELKHLSGPGRTEIAERIEAARDEGDLKEKGGYHAAREEQGKLEARIRELEHLLQNANVSEPDGDESTVTPGKLVTLKMGRRTIEFLLGSREIISEEDHVDVFSEKSPLGTAVNGKKVGDKVEYEAPNGRMIEVTIESAKAY